MSLDWNAVGALSGWVAASVAISAFLLQRRQISFSANLDSLWRLQDEFNSPNMLEKRSRVAKRMLAKDPAPDRDTEDILDFFDLIGYLVDKKALDKKTAWMLFSDACISYWVGATTYLAANNSNSIYWGHLASLMSDVFLPLERRKGKLSAPEVEDRAKQRSDMFLRLEVVGKTARVSRRVVSSDSQGRPTLTDVGIQQPQPAESPATSAP